MTKIESSLLCDAILISRKLNHFQEIPAHLRNGKGGCFSLYDSYFQ